VTIHDMQEVHQLEPLEGGGFAVTARHSGPIGRLERRHHYTAEQVVVSAHAYGTAHLLLEMQHDGHLPTLSSELGKRARTNSEALISVARAERSFKADPGQVHFVPGTSAVTRAYEPTPSRRWARCTRGRAATRWPCCTRR
jgi:cholesterol oxidase